MATRWMSVLAGMVLGMSSLVLAQEVPEPSGTADADLPAGSGSPRERPHPSPRQTQLDALAAELPAAQQLRLAQGEESFLALYRPQDTPRVAGVVLILHDLGQHADWPRVVAPARQVLPGDGWHTLSLNLPEFPEQELPLRVLPDKAELYAPQDDPQDAAQHAVTPRPADSLKPEQEGAGAASAGAVAEGAMIQLGEVREADATRTPEMMYEERSVQRMAVGVDYLLQQANGPLVLIGSGVSARLTALYLAASPQTPAGQEVILVWVNPKLKPEERQDFRRLLGTGPYPRILDLVEASGPESRERARVRRASARRLGLEHYEQVMLPAASASSPQDRALVQRLRTWLKANGVKEGS